MPRRKSADPITVEVIRNSLETAAQEMGITVGKLAHSIIFSEGKDFSAAIFTDGAEPLALAQYIPSHQGGIKTNLDSVLRIVGRDNLFPGDVVMMNDPYLGGLHAQDLTFIAPVFYGDRLVGYAGCVGHRTDMGGMAPSSWCPEANMAAAGTVHTDMQRGFIRAEVIAFDDFKEAGSMAEAQKAGKVRLEGKEHPINDGNIIFFRFNV